MREGDTRVRGCVKNGNTREFKEEQGRGAKMSLSLSLICAASILGSVYIDQMLLGQSSRAILQGSWETYVYIYKIDE